MKVVNDVEILTDVEELVEPSKTALIVIDVQNGIVNTVSSFEHSNTEASVENVRAVIPPTQKLRNRARSLKIPVIVAEFIHRDSNGNTLMNGPNCYCVRNADPVPDVVEGSWEAQTVDELAPKEGDYVIRKSRASAMYNTSLGDILQTGGIRNLLITGVITGGCVLMTAADVMMHGYYSVIVEDCVGSYEMKSHNMALEWMKTQIPVFSSAHVLSAWEMCDEL